MRKSPTNMAERVYKITLLGNEGVGKTGELVLVFFKFSMNVLKMSKLCMNFVFPNSSRAKIADAFAGVKTLSVF